MEGPGLVVLKEKAAKFKGKKVLLAYGSQKIDFDRITAQRLNDIKTWGKHLLLIFEDCTVRIHYLMFGQYILDAKHAEKLPKLALEFKTGEWNNYNCAVRILDGTNMDAVYDWSTDVMQDAWDGDQAVQKLMARPEMLVCDALMDQSIFTGVGNVIKNETLFRMSMDPRSTLGALSPMQLNALVSEARSYSFDFYRWEVEGTRRKKYCVHRKARCPDCNNRLTKEFTGQTPRSSFYCSYCQLLYTEPGANPTSL